MRVPWLLQMGVVMALMSMWLALPAAEQPQPPPGPDVIVEPNPGPRYHIHIADGVVEWESFNGQRRALTRLPRAR